MPNRVFRRLREVLWPATPAGPGAAPFVLHDDMFEDCEIMPASAADWCARQIAQIADFAVRHEAAGGAGWTDMHVRPPAPASVADLALPYAPAVAAVGGLLPEFAQVIAGGFADPRPRPIQGRAFGPSPLSAIVVYHDDAGRNVRHIAVTLRGDDAEVANVLAALAAIPAPAPLMIVNWARAIAARLDRANEVDAYLAGAKPREARGMG
jgi:hypothetical protein